MISRRQFGAALLLAGKASRLRGASGIGDALQESLQRRNIPAATAMVATADAEIYSGAFGARDAASGILTTIDTIFAIASMTKAVTSTAAMQLVERGRLSLDEPVGKHLPELAAVNVLHGFQPGTGEPILRPAFKPVTLRRLLSHSSGYAYDTWNEEMFEYAERIAPTVSGDAAGYPNLLWGRAPLPLICEPGECWQYGPSADWTSLLVEAVSGQSLDVYFKTNIFDPLEMNDTAYRLSDEQFDRMVSIHARQPDGSLKETPRKRPAPTTFFGGTGLYSTARDYTRFLQMFLRRGRGPGNERILQPETVDEMAANQIGNISPGIMKNLTGDQWRDLRLSRDPGDRFGLGFLVATNGYEGGRSPGSLAWAGGWNTFFWIDVSRGVCAVLMMQFQPFYDSAAEDVLTGFERAVYRDLA